MKSFGEILDSGRAMSGGQEFRPWSTGWLTESMVRRFKIATGPWHNGSLRVEVSNSEPLVWNRLLKHLSLLNRSLIGKQEPNNNPSKEEYAKRIHIKILATIPDHSGQT